MSGLFKKLIPAFRGGAREVGEAVVDMNAVRIYEQAIEDARNNLARAKRDLTGVIAKEMQAEREIKRIGGELERYEQHAIDALNKGREDLAEQVAVKIAELEAERGSQEAARTQFHGHVERLKDVMKQTEATIRQHERELAMVRTTESVQKATRSITDNYGAGATRLLDAKSSLERIKKRQQDFSDRMAAADALEQESGSGSLDDKLKAAGIAETSAGSSEVLARLKKRAGGGQV